MKARNAVLALVAAVAFLVVMVGPAWAHGDESNIPAKDSLATAMSLLQVQPDMTDMIADKIGDGLDSSDTSGVNLDLTLQAQKSFEAGQNADALALLEEATGLTPAEALAMQTEDTTRPSSVPLADQLATEGSVGRPSPAVTVILGIGAVLAIALGVVLVRTTR